MIGSYPSIYAIGHKAIADLFSGPVLVEEKIDGSQFSMGVLDGELVCRSKGKQLILDAPEKMFTKAVETVKILNLRPGLIYRCEYLSSPKHNTLAYDRAPDKNLILFDIDDGLQTYASAEEKKAEADRIGLECVPVLYSGTVDNFAMFENLLETVSCLGGSKVEGVVVKNYSLFTMEKKVAMGKYVSERFKEVHGGEWRKANPTQTDIVDRQIAKYKTPARWDKAVQHMRDAGTLEGSPRDIAVLIKEVPDDILKECENEIKDALFAHFWPKIRRGVTAGLPEWYKEELAKSAFGKEETNGDSHST
jgi:hypothetical protein